MLTQGISDRIMSVPVLLEGHRLLSLRFDSTCTSCHQVLFKPHRVRDPCERKPNLRTLFLSNVPPWADKEAIRRIFSVNGAVEEVILQRRPSSGPPDEEQRGEEEKVGRGFRYAYVVFDRPSGVRRAMEKMDLSQPKLASTESRPILVGMDKWRAEYNESIQLDTDALEKEIEEGVANMDRQKEEEARKVRTSGHF